MSRNIATKVTNMMADWAKKDADAQTEAVTRLGLPANNTAKDRAKAMGFGDDVYHGTRADDFDNFSLDEASKHKAIYTTPDTTVSDKFASDDFYTGYRVGPPRVLPLKTRGNLFDYDNPEHIKLLENEIGPYEYDLSKGFFPFLENKAVQGGIRKLGFDGFNVAELGAKNTGTYNPTNIRSKFAHFNPKLAGVGAGSVLSADLMADELDLEYKGQEPSAWDSLMKDIGNVNQQQAQGVADMSANVIGGTASVASMLATDPAVVGEVISTAGLKTLGAVSPYIKGFGLGLLLDASELGNGSMYSDEEFIKILEEKQ